MSSLFSLFENPTVQDAAMGLYSSCIPTVTPGDAHSHFTKTWLNVSFTQSAFDQGKRAFQNRQYEQAIDSYTQALFAMQAHVASILLLHRAAAYEMDNQFDKARQDSQDAMACAEPTCPDAYFSYASACYFTGHLSAALAAYRKGIDRVPKDAPMHKELVRKHDQLAEEVHQRNQTLARRLPFEVIHNVLSRVSLADRMQFAQTCRFWNRWLMHEYPNMWYELDGNDLRRPINTTIDWIPQQCIRSITLDLTPGLSVRHDDGDGYLSTRAHINSHLLSGSEVIANTMHKWKYIETLDISNYENEQLPRILEPCKDSLKRLTLNINSTSHEFAMLQSLVDVVRICRNLQYLTIQAGSQCSMRTDDLAPSVVNTTLRTAFAAALDSSSALPLTQLRLFNEIPVDLLALLLARCSNLTMLNLTHWSGQLLAQVLQLIHANCPQLRTFVYGDRPHALSNVTAVLCPDDPAPGLRTISISPLRADNRTETFKELENLFQRHRNTLLHMYIGNSLLGAYKCRILKLAADQGLPRLQTLHTWHSAQLDEKRICALLKACPSLESVSLHNRIPLNYQTLLETLGDLSKLKHLDIQTTWEDVFLSNENTYFSSWKHSMKSLFRNAPVLHTFVFGTVQDPPKGFEAPMMETIATLVSNSSVQKLDLHNLGLRTPAGFDALLKGLKDSQVRELIVGADFGRTPPWQPMSFRRVALIPHLAFFKVCNRGAYFDAKDVELILDEHQNPHPLVVWFDSKHSHVNGCKFAGDSYQYEDDTVKGYHIQVKSKATSQIFRSSYPHPTAHVH